MAGLGGRNSEMEITSFLATARDEPGIIVTEIMLALAGLGGRSN